MNKHTRILLATAALFGASTGFAAIVSSDFSTFTNGNLVGQNGWTQFNAPATAPIQVAGGKVTWAGGATVDNQDAFLPLGTIINQPASGTTVVYVATQLSVFTAGANPTYFAALNQNQTASSASSNFQNARLVAKDNPGDGTFDFGSRMNGQTGYPFVYGNAGLTYGATYNLVARISMVSGNANDVIDLFVTEASQPFDFVAAYSTSAYTSGTVADPSFGGLLLSQFGSGTVNQSGVAINKVMVTSDLAEVQAFVVTAIPEPSTYAALAGAVAFAGVTLSRRRRV